MTSMHPTRKKALALSLFTAGYNLLEGVVSIVTSVLAGSGALLGFRLDAFVESLSGSVMVWRFWKFGIDVESAEIANVERKAARFIAYTFFILGGYVIFDAGKSLYLHEVPKSSTLGLIIAGVSIIVMPILFVAKYRLGKKIGSESLVADSKETLACVMLSVSLLVGLGLNSFFGLWWADPAAAIVIAVLVLREGWETYEASRPS